MRGALREFASVIVVPTIPPKDKKITKNKTIFNKENNPENHTPAPENQDYSAASDDQPPESDDM